MIFRYLFLRRFSCPPTTPQLQQVPQIKREIGNVPLYLKQPEHLPPIHIRKLSGYLSEQPENLSKFLNRFAGLAFVDDWMVSPLRREKRKGERGASI